MTASPFGSTSPSSVSPDALQMQLTGPKVTPEVEKSPVVEPVSTQVLAAASLARIRFGSSGTTVTAAELVEAGARLLSPSAPSGRAGRRAAANGNGPSHGGPEVAAIGLVMSNDRPTVECVLGAIAVGATVVSLPPPPPRGQVPDDYVALLQQALSTHNLPAVIARDNTATRLGAAGLTTIGHSALEDGSMGPLVAPDGPSSSGFRLVQYSSGATAAPKPILLDDRGLGINVAAILERLGPGSGDGVVSWLPLSHDMGLIGMLLATVVGLGQAGALGGELTLLEPETFLRSPARWLHTVSAQQATITACPDFGLRWLTQRPGPQVDLSSLRCVIIGGEVVRADTLTAVAHTFQPWGWRPETLCPSYGLAELGLAATMTPPGQGWRNLAVAAEALADGRVDPNGPGRIGDEHIRPSPAVERGDSITLVSSGPPLPGYDLRCNGECTDMDHGTYIGSADGHSHEGDRNGSVDFSSNRTQTTGRVQVRGGSIGANGLTGTSLAGHDDWLPTGDVGFLDDQGWLTITGRNDDYVVANGRNLYAPALDEAAGQVAGVRAGRAAVLGTPTGELVVVAETRARATTAHESIHIRTHLRRSVALAGGVQPDDVLLVRRGEIPYTTSGKLRRAELARQLLHTRHMPGH